jgi:putative ABC transport system permease protein
VQLASVTFDGSFSAIDATVIGIHTTGLEETESSSVVAPLSALQRLYDTDAVTMMAVYLKDAHDAAGYAARLEAQLRRAGVQVSVYPFDDERISLMYVGTHRFLRVMAAFIGLIVFTVIVLSVVNATTLTVLDRTREFATFRSLGFTRRELVGLFLREGIALTGIGIAVGSAVAFAVSTAVDFANIRYRPPGVTGDMQFLLIPNARVYAGIAVAMLALSAAAVVFAVRWRVRARIADMNTAVAA